MPRHEVRGKMRFFAGRTAKNLILPTSYCKGSAAREENPPPMRAVRAKIRAYVDRTSSDIVGQ